MLALVGLLLASRAGRSSRAIGPPGLPAASRPEPPAAAEPPAAPEVPPEHSIRGVVRDTRDAPVAGAEMTATDRYDETQVARARTAPDGTFVLGPLERGFMTVVAEHPERGVASGDGQPGDFLELWLQPGAGVTGTVRARDGGQPLAGASVHVGRSVATTDAEGRYSFRNLPPPVWQIIAVADGYRQARRSLTIGPGDTRALDFALERGATLAGLVTDAQTGAPIAGAVVAERADRYGSAGTLSAADRRVTTDTEGRYALEGVPAEPSHMFLCFAGGYVAAEREGDGSKRLDFALERGLAASGQVVDPDGRPVPGAIVFLHRVAEAGGSVFRGKLRSQRTETDADGRFRFENVVPGTVAFVAIAKGFAPDETAALDAKNLPDVVVRLAHGMTLDITVRDADGRVVPGASLSTGTPTEMGDRFAPAYDGRERMSLRTDEQGRVRLEGLIPGDYPVGAWHALHGHAYAKASGKAGDTVSIELAFRGHEIRGRVVTAKGEPAAGAHVVAFGQNHSETAFADGLGRFRLPGLPAGSLRVQARGAGGASAPVEVEAGTQGVELRLAAQTLRGTVRGAEKGLLGNFSVRFQLKAPRINMGVEVEGGDGRFEEPVPPGTYDLTARAPGHRPKVVRGVVVTAGSDPPPMEFVLEPAATLRGTARGRDGRVLRYVFVSTAPTKPGEGLDSSFDRTDQEGRFLIEGVGPGAYAVVLNGERAGTSRTLVEVPSAGTVTLDLRLGPTGTVVVRVADAEGKPVARAYVTFTYADHGAFAGEAALTDVEGTVVSGPLPAEVALIARAQLEDRRAEVPVSVGPGGKAEARIVLPGN